MEKYLINPNQKISHISKDIVKIFADFRKLKDGFTAALPKCSVAKFTIE